MQQKRWKVETFSRLDSVLLLSSVNLPGGVLVSPVAMVTTRPCARSQGVLILRSPSLVPRPSSKEERVSFLFGVLKGEGGGLGTRPHLPQLWGLGRNLGMRLKLYKYVALPFFFRTRRGDDRPKMNS